MTSEESTTPDPVELTRQAIDAMTRGDLDVGNGVVFAAVSQKARPVGTTGYVRQREGWVWPWVDGLIATLTVYPEAEIDEARAAAERLAEERE